MNILKHIWPWSKIAKLEAEVENERYWRSQVEDFVSQCVAYLDHLEPNVQHIRLNRRLYCVGVDYCKEVHYTSNPRTNFKIKGITAPGSGE